MDCPQRAIRPKTKPPRFRSGELFRAYNRGAEGQSRTATGLRPPGFELDTMPSAKWCHVLRRLDFEANTGPNLEPRVVMW